MSLSQSTSARAGLEQLQRLIGAGYQRDRGTGMSDLVVTSRPVLVDVLTAVQPYVVFKRIHVREALRLFPRIQPRCSAEQFLQVARQVDAFAALNYSKTKRISAADAEQLLRGKGVCAPVTTSLQVPTQGDGSPADYRTVVPITRRPLETG